MTKYKVLSVGLNPQCPQCKSSLLADDLHPLFVKERFKKMINVKRCQNCNCVFQEIKEAKP